MGEGDLLALVLADDLFAEWGVGGDEGDLLIFYLDLQTSGCGGEEKPLGLLIDFHFDQGTEVDGVIGFKITGFHGLETGGSLGDFFGLSSLAVGKVVGLGGLGVVLSVRLAFFVIAALTGLLRGLLEAFEVLFQSGADRGDDHRFDI